MRGAPVTGGWVEATCETEGRAVVGRVNVAVVRAGPESSAAVVFQAEQNVLLERADASYATATPGWAKVRHRDGQTGYVRISQVWGL